MFILAQSNTSVKAPQIVFKTLYKLKTTWRLARMSRMYLVELDTWLYIGRRAAQRIPDERRADTELA